MATAIITQWFGEGAAVEVVVDVESSYPDACAEAVAQAIRLWRGAVPDDAEVET